MNDEEQATGVDDAGEQQSAAENQEENRVSAEVEQEAREMGWVPKDRYRGNPDDWRDADEFVKRGKELLPIVNAQLKKERAKTENLERQLDEARSDFAKQIDGLKKATRAGLKQREEEIRERYEERKRSAVEIGDTDAYDKAVAGEAKAMKSLADHAEDEGDKEDAGKKQAQPKPSEVQQAWLDENQWYGKDKKLTRWANTFADDLEDEMPAASQAEKLSEIRERLEEKFPDDFGRKRERPRSRVEGGDRGGGGGERSRWSRLPQSFRAAADELIKEDGLFAKKGENPKENAKHLAAARERYAAEIADEHLEA